MKNKPENLLIFVFISSEKTTMFKNTTKALYVRNQQNLVRGSLMLSNESSRNLIISHYHN